MKHRATGVRAGILAALILAWALPAEAGLFDFLKGDKKGDEQGEGDERQGDKNIDRFKPPDLAVYEMLAAKRPLSLSIARSEGAGLVPSPALNGYVNLVLRRVVANSPVPELQARAFVRASERFGASASPDGAIFVNMKLLHEIESEDELAAVLAHELAHVLYRHHGADWFVKSQKLATQASSLGDHFKGIVSKSPGEESNSTLLIAFGAELSERVVAPNLWTKNQEEEADRLGLDILVAAQYHSRVPFKTLKRLAAWEDRQRQRSREDLDKLGEETGEKIKEDAAKGNIQGILVTVIVSAIKLGKSAAEKAMDAIDDDHRPPEERIKRLKAYFKMEHRAARADDKTQLPWNADPGHRTSAVMNNYRTAFEALQALETNKLGDAVELSRAATRDPTKTDNYPRLIFSNVRSQQGNSAKSYLNLKIATRGSEPAFMVYEMMVEQKLASGQKDEAVRLLAEASRRLGDPPHLMPYRIAILSDAGRALEANALMTDCKLSFPDLGPFCERALGGTRALAKGGKGEGEDEGATGRLIDRESSDLLRSLNK